MVSLRLNRRPEHGDEVLPSPLPGEGYDENSVDPYEFVRLQEGPLSESREAWGVIASELQMLREPAYIEGIKAGVGIVWEGQYYQGTEADQERAADKLASELSTYSLLVNRHLSDQGFRVSNAYSLAKRTRDHWLNLPNSNVAFIVGPRNKAFPARRFLTKQILIVDKMHAADQQAETILTDLVSTYFDKPEQLDDLADLYSGGIADVDPNFKELRQIIAVDWHHPDRSKSLLRQYCEQLREDPRRYLEAFSRQVVRETSNEQLLALQKMARFAVINANRDKPVTDETMQEAVIATYDRWDEVEGIERLFRAFVDVKVAKVEEVLGTIAGARMVKNIRMHPARSDIERLQSGLFIDKAKRIGLPGARLLEMWQERPVMYWLHCPQQMI